MLCQLALALLCLSLVFGVFVEAAYQLGQGWRTWLAAVIPPALAVAALVALLYGAGSFSRLIP